MFLKRELSLPVPLSPPSLSLSLRRPEATSPNLLRNAGIFFNPCFSRAVRANDVGTTTLLENGRGENTVLIRLRTCFSAVKRIRFAAYLRSRDLLENGKARPWYAWYDKVNQNLGARFNGRILFSRRARWAIKSAATLTSEISRESDERATHQPTRTPAPAKDRALFKIAFNYEYNCCGLEPPVVGILVTR